LEEDGGGRVETVNQEFSHLEKPWYWQRFIKVVYEAEPLICPH